MWDWVKKNTKYIFWVIISGAILVGLMIAKSAFSPLKKETDVVKIDVEKKDYPEKAKYEAAEIDKKIRDRRPKPMDDPGLFVRDFLKRKTR